MGFKQVVRVSDAFMMLKLNLFAAEQCSNIHVHNILSKKIISVLYL